MEYRALGDTGLTVSAIGFGCWEMGNPGYGSTDESEVIAAVHRAMELGVTLFDTAPNYGFGGSEIVLGKALGERRKDIVLVSKVGITWDPVTNTTKFDGRYSTIKRINEESLQRLGTDHVDLLLMHWPDPETPIAETMRALEELKAEGKTKHIGVSNFTSYELREAKSHAPICANQVGYNLFDRRWEREMFPTAQEIGVGVMAYGPMAHGLLTGTSPARTPLTRRTGGGTASCSGSGCSARISGTTWTWWTSWPASPPTSAPRSPGWRWPGCSAARPSRWRSRGCRSPARDRGERRGAGRAAARRRPGRDRRDHDKQRPARPTWSPAAIHQPPTAWKSNPSPVPEPRLSRARGRG